MGKKIVTVSNFGRVLFSRDTEPSMVFLWTDHWNRTRLALHVFPHSTPPKDLWSLKVILTKGWLR